MAIESYEQIMARLNGQQTQTPKAATDFTTYVQNLLLNTNPQGGMMTDAEAYRADPLRRQNVINASLDEALKKKQAEKAARAAAIRGGMGMMGSVSGESGDGITLTPEQIASLDSETLDQRGERLKSDWLGLKPMALAVLAPGLFMKEYGGDFRANFNSGISNFLGGLFGQVQPTISRNPYETMIGSQSSTPSGQPNISISDSLVRDRQGNIVRDRSGMAIGTGSTSDAISQAESYYGGAGDTQTQNSLSSSNQGDYYG